MCAVFTVFVFSPTTAKQLDSVYIRPSSSAHNSDRLKCNNVIDIYDLFHKVSMYHFNYNALFAPVLY